MKVSGLYVDFKGLAAYSQRPEAVDTVAHVADAPALAKLLGMAQLVELGFKVTGQRYGLKSAKLKVAEKVWPALVERAGAKAAASGGPLRRPGKTSHAKRFRLAVVDADKVDLVNEHGRLILAELARICASTPDGFFGKPEVLQMRANVDLDRRLREAKPTKQKLKLLVAHWLHYLKRWGGILEAREPKKEGATA